MEFDFEPSCSAKTGGNISEFTVSELSGAIKKQIETSFSHVRVRGELGRVSSPASGHIYLDLKDERSVISGVIWRGKAQSLKIRPEQGLEVIVTGKLTTYPGQSRYQIVIEAMEPAGQGALMALLEARKKQFETEGLFAEERKKPIPFLPRVIGIVTSPTGAVIRDIMHGFTERFPAHVIVWPVRVQGETSAAEVARAIAGFNQLRENSSIPRPDLLIVARGGGSLEDLWGFNEEMVVRAASQSAIPIISAVGHETDWSLLDLVADSRAPTPTKAAEWAVPKLSELLLQLKDFDDRRHMVLVRRLEAHRHRLRAAARGLPRNLELVAIPRQRLDIAQQNLTHVLSRFIAVHRQTFARSDHGLRPALLESRLLHKRQQILFLADKNSQTLWQNIHRQRREFLATASKLRPTDMRYNLSHARENISSLLRRSGLAMGIHIKQKRANLNSSEKMLHSLGYHNVLKRGFALIRDHEGGMVKTAEQLKTDDRVEIEMMDGIRPAIISNDDVAKSDERVGGEPKAKPSKEKTKSSPSPGSQGTLF